MTSKLEIFIKIYHGSSNHGRIYSKWYVLMFGQWLFKCLAISLNPLMRFKVTLTFHDLNDHKHHLLVNSISCEDSSWDKV